MALRWMLATLALLCASGVEAADLRVLTAGAYKPVLTAMQPAFEAASGDHLLISNDTAGAIAKRVDAGEAVDVVVSSQEGIAQLVASGRLVAASARALATVGIGVAVKAGAPEPNIATLADFRAALLAAPSIAYLDPAAGGSSGIYLTALFEKMGIAAEIRPKAVLVNGGLVAERLLDGRAALAVHQMSELKAVPGVVIVGPIPAEVQNTTIYAGAITPGAPASASALLATLRTAAAVLADKGMQPPP